MSYTIPIASLSIDANGRIVTSSTVYQDFTGTTPPSVSAPGHGKIYYDSGTNLFKMSLNGAAYVTLGSGGGGSGTVDPGTANRFAIYPSSTSEVGDTYINNGFNVILTGPTTVMGQSTTFSLNDPGISQAKIWTATNSAPSINSIVTTNNVGNMVTTNVINSQINLNSNGIINLGFEDFIGVGSPGVSASGHGRIYFDSGSNTFQISQNGGAYASLGGITQLTGDVTAGPGTGSQVATIAVGSTYQAPHSQVNFDSGGVTYVTGITTSITTTGNPVLILAHCSMTWNASAGGSIAARVRIDRDAGGAFAGNYQYIIIPAGMGSGAAVTIPISLAVIETPTAAAHTYRIAINTFTGTLASTAPTGSASLVAIELKK